MKTIKYKEIDGYFVYDGFDILPADPVETHKAADAIFQETDICKKMQKKAAEKMDHWRSHVKAMKTAKALKISGDTAFKQKDNANFKKFKSEQTKAEKEANDRAGAANICDGELLEMRKEADALKRELRQQNIVYAPGPRKNEVFGTQEDVDAVILAALSKPENTAIALDLALENEIIIEADDPAGTGERQECRQYRLNSATVEQIPDFRGKQYFYKDKSGTWIESEVISALGVTVNTVVVDEFQSVAIERGDLTTQQLVEISIQKLDESQKTAEYTAKYQGLVSQAAAMKTELEITGSSQAEALSQAQAWLAGKESELKILYGVA